MINANTAFKTRSAANQAMRYYLWRRPAYFWIIFPIFWAFLLFKLHFISEAVYVQRRWHFLARRPLTTQQWQGLTKKLPLRARFRYADHITVADQIPQFILELLVAGSQLDARGAAISVDGKADVITPMVDVFQPSGDLGILVTPDFYRSFLRKSANKSAIRIFDMDREFASYGKYQAWQWLWQLRNGLILLAAALIVTFIALFIAYYHYGTFYVTDILHIKRLMLANVVPVLAIMTLVYFLTNSVSWAVALGGLPFPLLALVNFFMLEYRSFPLEFPDIFLASEASNMGKRYSYVPPRLYALLLIFIVALGILCHFFLKSPRRGFVWRACFSLLTVVAIVFGTKSFYLNDAKFASIITITHGNIWDKTNRYATNGFVYSFMNTLNKGQVQAPAGYSAAGAKKDLGQYKTQNIPNNKRINVITIQLEAFQDFSKYPQIHIDPSVYAGLHQVEKEASSGELSTTIFGGGTVDTERKVLTGYSVLPNLRTDTNAFPYYFSQQGFNTYFAHDGYAWFYNRQNIDRYLGFKENLFKENYYTKNVSGASIIPDSLMFPDLYKHFQNKTKNGKYLFTQNVTYQNHGPYPTTFNGKKLVQWQPGYNQSDYAIINNYLTGVKKTSDQLLALTNRFKNSKKPVVLAFWGDHNPWGGLNNSTYKMLKINLDQGTQQGINDFFNTPYVIYANAAAKKRLKTQFPTNGPTISPMYMLPTIFTHAGWKGNQYMQVLQKMQQTIPVYGLNKDMYKGQFTAETDLPANVRKQIKQFQETQFYMQTNFKGQATDVTK
ncbi:sulfatase-like hydrolase/transferase [Lacticaseibacillus pabuli]|uniref:Sulfatase-like hydrolase/transferase n=1 Tax=Lacticaseibacillus pabuli TaxID=3025672 RepID=A0ABY7WPK1_9LACO|nr:LTA synthase family protein [Lacticaseibacillus sp. KACC 23028]WDF82036.1 sulfatase-like hydrolase/transferase [Lacticaseibacillus sp. KACC 23028]